MLYHLRDAGFKGRQLYCLYCCFIRLIFEYCSVVYHAMLTMVQEQQLKRLQRHALRLCFGHQEPIENVMANESIETLRDRRLRRCDAFFRKAVKSSRFWPRWFPERRAVQWDLRRRRNIKETCASTSRRYNSPLSFLKRRANDMGVIARPAQH